MVLFATNWKVQFCGTVPLCVVAQFINLKKAYSSENENMACFVRPDTVANTLIFRFFGMMGILCYALHSKYRTEITQFLERRQANQ